MRTKKVNLFKLRGARGWSQQAVADKIGISRSYYSMLESCGRRPSVAVAKKLAEVFHLDSWYMFFDQIR